MAAQNPCGVQLGWPSAITVRDGRARHRRLGGKAANASVCCGRGAAATRAGLIHAAVRYHRCRLPRDVTGDAAGIVSPVTAGGIHSSWAHGWAIGEAVAKCLRSGGPAPERVAQQAAPRFRSKRALRWAFDRWQLDWPFELLLHTTPLRWAAEQVYFHRRGRQQGR